MHIFFSGIGGTAIGPLALIAKQAGYDVSGSDKQDSSYIKYLRAKGLNGIHIGQTLAAINKVNDSQPIDWVVVSSAIEKEDQNHPELLFAKNNNIKLTKRDELIKKILKDKKIKMVAIAGTHGKTTTTAMAIWLFKQLGLPVSYSVGAKIPFGDMGQFQEGSEYFIYECDEFDRNFLSFEPYLSLITGVTWDHHEIYPTRDDYKLAFKDFINQSQNTIIWHDDADYLQLHKTDNIVVLEGTADEEEVLNIAGFYNRLDAWLAAAGVSKVTSTKINDIAKHFSGFPGLQRRMDQIIPGLYSDYAHTPEKIRGAMSVALELAQQNPTLKAKQNRPKTKPERTDLSGFLTKNDTRLSVSSNSSHDRKGRTFQVPGVVVVYEPLTNRRQHYMMDEYKDCFAGAKKVYWLPSYLAREDPSQRVIPPTELISHLSDPNIAEPAQMGAELKKTIQAHLDSGDMVVGMAGGGGGSLDEWLRKSFL